MTGSAPTPQAMTLEEATALHGLTFVRNLDDSAWVAGRIRFLSPHDHSKYAHAWEPLGVGATWAEAASQALGYPVVERDPTAELVEALEAVPIVRFNEPGTDGFLSCPGCGATGSGPCEIDCYAPKVEAALAAYRERNK